MDALIFFKWLLDSVYIEFFAQHNMTKIKKLVAWDILLLFSYLGLGIFEVECPVYML